MNSDRFIFLLLAAVVVTGLYTSGMLNLFGGAIGATGAVDSGSNNVVGNAVVDTVVGDVVVDQAPVVTAVTGDTVAAAPQQSPFRTVRPNQIRSIIHSDYGNVQFPLSRPQNANHAAILTFGGAVSPKYSGISWKCEKGFTMLDEPRYATFPCRFDGEQRPNTPTQVGDAAIASLAQPLQNTRKIQVDLAVYNAGKRSAKINFYYYADKKWHFGEFCIASFSAGRQKETCTKQFSTNYPKVEKVMVSLTPYGDVITPENPAIHPYVTDIRLEAP